MENAFGFLKQTYRELQSKSDLHVTFLPEVVVCCAILHNILLKQSHHDIERLLEVLQREASTSTEQEEEMRPAAATESPEEQVQLEVTVHKRSELGVLLSL